MTDIPLTQWSGLTLLVFGGAGQVGQAIGQSPPPDGWRVICASRADANITRADEVDRLVAHVEPDVIVNAAAFTAVDEAQAVPNWAAQVNSHGAAHVAQAALPLGADHSSVHRLCVRWPCLAAVV